MSTVFHLDFFAKTAVKQALFYTETKS
jgi:hypothetical protein